MLVWLLARLRAVLFPMPRPALVRIQRASAALARRPLRRRTFDL